MNNQQQLRFVVFHVETSESDHEWRHLGSRYRTNRFKIHWQCNTTRIIVGSQSTTSGSSSSTLPKWRKTSYETTNGQATDTWCKFLSSTKSPSSVFFQLSRLKQYKLGPHQSLWLRLTLTSVNVANMDKPLENVIVHPDKLQYCSGKTRTLNDRSICIAIGKAAIDKGKLE